MIHMSYYAYIPNLLRMLLQRFDFLESLACGKHLIKLLELEHKNAEFY
jgi:hypothetical protein